MDRERHTVISANPGLWIRAAWLEDDEATVGREVRPIVAWRFSGDADGDGEPLSAVALGGGEGAIASGPVSGDIVEAIVFDPAGRPDARAESPEQEAETLATLKQNRALLRAAQAAERERLEKREREEAEGIYRCQKCGAEFATEAQRDNHVRVKHPTRRAYQGAA